MPDLDQSPIHYVDAHVGQKIRQRRVALNMDQDSLARRVGVSFQQIQKYERATNRVSASRLFDIAWALGVDVDYFFRDLENGDPEKNPAIADGVRGISMDAAGTMDPMKHAQSIDLALAFWSLPEDGMRASFISLLNSMSRTED